MKQKSCLSVLALAATLGACGGGGEESGETGSSAQSRTRMEPKAAIELVQAAEKTAGRIDLIERFLLLFAPRASSVSGQDLKAVGTAKCTAIFKDPNCKGRFTFESEFPLNQAQQAMRAGSKLSVDWDGVEAQGLTPAGGIASRWTFRFATDLPLTSRYTGQFQLSQDRTKPFRFVSNDTLKLEELTLKYSASMGSDVIDGRLILNPYTGGTVNNSETITFRNWALIRSKLQAGSRIEMASKLYGEGTQVVLRPTYRVEVTVVSSDTGRTEYRVFGKSDADDEGTTRTVIATLDSNGELVYSAS